MIMDIDLMDNVGNNC